MTWMEQYFATIVIVLICIVFLVYVIRNSWTFHTLSNSLPLAHAWMQNTGMSSEETYYYVYWRFWVWDIEKLLDHKAYNATHQQPKSK